MIIMGILCINLLYFLKFLERHNLWEYFSDQFCPKFPNYVMRTLTDSKIHFNYKKT